MKFEIKKFINQVAIIPDDTKEWTKWGVALVVAILAKYGMNLGEAETILLTGFVKALADYIHFSMKNREI